MPERNDKKQPTGNELFRMVNVRNPKRRRRDRNPYSDIKWPISLLEDNFPESLLPLIHAEAGNEDKEVGLTNILTLLEQFKRDRSFLESMKDVEEKFKIALNTNEALAQINTKDLSLAELETGFSRLIQSTPSTDYINIEKMLWENLIFQLISPEDLYVRGIVVALIKTYHIAKTISDADLKAAISEDSSLLLKLINAKVVLPKSVFPLHRIEDGGEITSEYQKYMDEQKEIVIQREAYKLELEKLKVAQNELLEVKGCKRKSDDKKSKANSILQNEYNGNIEVFIKNMEQYEKDLEEDPDNAGEPPLRPEFPELQAINNDEIDTTEAEFSEETLDLLNGFKCLVFENKLSIPEASKKLQQEINKISSKIASNIKAYTKVIPFGKGFVKINENFSMEDFQEEITGSRGLPSPSYNVLGVGDLLKVEQEILCYEAGEVAHIENVLKGEFKDRSTRSLNRREETSITEEETFTSERKDLESTDRNEMSKESSSVVNKDFSIDGGVQTSGKYGPVEVQTNINAGYSESSSDYNSSAVNYSKSVTERATSIVEKRVRKYNKVTIINEFEEINKHGFENRQVDGGDPVDHIVGIYRWVNKVYKNTLWNYGNRLMLEFMVPEPSAYHIMAKNNKDEYGLNEPEAPLELTIKDHGVSINSALDISESNYIHLAQIYGAKVTPPPPDEIIVNKSVKHGQEYDHDTKPGKKSMTGDISIDVPEGYLAYKYKISGLHVTRWDDWYGAMRFYCGHNSVWFVDHDAPPSEYTYLTGKNITVSWRLYRAHNFSANIIIKCERTDEALTQWKLDTYSAILDAYKQQKSEYDQKLAQARAREGIQIQGSNPLLYQTIISDELKKACIQMMSNEVFEEKEYGSYPHSNKLHTEAYPRDYKYGSSMPDMNIQKASERAGVIRFFEQVFEWDQMTYKLYPYYWANKNRWINLYNLDDNDPLFANFLKSGAARVVVPIRQGFEDAFAYFKETNTIPASLSNIKLEDEHYLSISDELKPNDEKTFVESWETALPTNLVILQKDASGLDTDGLPCWREE